MLSTKDAGGFLRHFQGLTEVCGDDGNWAMPPPTRPTNLRTSPTAQGIAADPPSSLEAAFAKSLKREHGPVRIMVTGSLYLAGQVLEAHEQSAS